MRIRDRPDQLKHIGNKKFSIINHTCILLVGTSEISSTSVAPDSSPFGITPKIFDIQSLYCLPSFLFLIDQTNVFNNPYTICIFWIFPTLEPPPYTSGPQGTCCGTELPKISELEDPLALPVPHFRATTHNSPV